MRVPAAAARVAVRVQLVDEPEVDVRLRVREEPRHLDSLALVAVDAADDEDPRALARHVHDLDRPALVRASELLRRSDEEGGDDQGAQHHPPIVGNERERNWADTSETARICLGRPSRVKTS